MKKILIVVALASSAFCQVRQPDYKTYPYQAGWCSARDTGSDKVYYSDVFQFPNVNPAPNYGNEFKAYVAGLKEGPKSAFVHCSSWPITDTGTVSRVTRNRDNNVQVSRNQKKNVIMTSWVVAPLKHPELQYAWCNATPTVLDERVYEQPYSDIFLYDPAYDKSHGTTYATDFMSFLKKKNHLDYIPHCTVAGFGGEPAAKASFDQWLKQEGGKDQPIATHWKP